MLLEMEEEILEKTGRGTFFDWKEERAIMQARMSKSGAFLREKDALETALKETLARYMMPDVFVHLDDMPHTPTMKINRVELKKMMQIGK